MSTNLDPTSPLTPSELVLLNSDPFTGEANVNIEDLLNVKAKNLAKQVGEAILTAAYYFFLGR